MTKLRDPDSIHDALRLAIGLLGDRRLADLLGCSPQLVTAYADPDDEREISVKRAVQVDAAMVHAGFQAVFAPLLGRYAEAAAPQATAEPPQTPLAAVIGVAGTIGHALSTMASAARDGTIDRGELQRCLTATDKLGKELHRCRRVLFAALRRRHP